MPFSRRNRRKAGIELDEIITFLIRLLAMIGALTIVTVIGMFASMALGRDVVIYQICFILNSIMLLLGGFAVYRLKLKNSVIKEKEEKLQ